MESIIKIGSCYCGETTYDSICYSCRCITTRHIQAIRNALSDANIMINPENH